MTCAFLDPRVSVGEMVRLVGKGGLVVLVVNATKLREPEHEDVLKRLENACDEIVRTGLCECLQRSIVPDYYKGCEGIMWVFRKLQ